MSGLSNEDNNRSAIVTAEERRMLLLDIPSHRKRNKKIKTYLKSVYSQMIKFLT